MIIPVCFCNLQARVCRGVFAPFPLKEKMTEGEFPQMVVTERAGYIAKTKGNRYVTLACRAGCKK